MFIVLALLLTCILFAWFSFIGLILTAAILSALKTLCGTFKRRILVEENPATAKMPFFLFLIPAHNEAEIIERTLQSVKAVDYPRDKFKIMVIADNCTDETSSIARKEGAEVFERYDLSRKSKGFALHDTIKKVFSEERFQEIEALVIIDADTQIEQNLLTSFKKYLQKGQDWLQVYYTVSNPDDSWRTKLMTYAFALFNGVWELGCSATGLGAALRGNGMCFSKDGLLRRPWIASGLAEDLEFSWHLRLAQERVYFLPNTRVFGEMTSQSAASKSQRRRWEAGRKALRSEFRGKLIRALDIPLWKRIFYFIDLHFPSLSELTILFSCNFVLICVLLLFEVAPKNLSWLLFFAHCGFASIFAAYLVSPFFIMRLPLRYGRIILSAPYFIIWKLATMFGKHPDQWIRTARGNQTKENQTQQNQRENH